ncbi:MAG: SBBP repeat-containing protein [Candidatus Sulfotelmatobacter sp.]
MSKPSTSIGWVCAFCTVPVLAIAAVAWLVLSPAQHYTAANGAAGMASAASRPPQPGTATPAARGRIQASYAALPLAFEQNQGQTDAQVKYMARGNGYTLFLTTKDAVFSLRSPSAESKTATVRRGTELHAKNSPRQRNTRKNSIAVVHMQLVGGNSLAKVSASGQLPGKSNYFLGNDPSQWHTDVAHYARVSYQDVYPGVNLAFHGVQRQLEFDFVVAPGANPAPIGFHFTGAQGMKTDDSGNLVISSAAGDVLLHKPVAYQEQNGARQPVDARFALKANNQVSFELGKYDHSHELVIDPSVSYLYSTYLGGSGKDEGYGIAFDSSNNAYVTGQTASSNFPTTSGAFQTALTGTANVFVTSIAADGSSLIYSTYVGGNGSDSGNAIAVDQTSGAAYVVGGTTSSDFPHTTGAFQTTLNGQGNAFVFELSPGGSLTYSTYLGGTGTDVALGIALASDHSGDVYVAGKTSSLDFPTTLGPLQTSGGGFVTKLNSSGTALAYSTYLAVAGDHVNAIAVDSSDNAYVTGQTFSSSFHTTPGAFQITCGSCTAGNSNAFVTVLNPAGSAYVYSTFLGGSVIDAGDGIVVDSSDNAYVTGVTESSNFPTTSGAYQRTYGGSTDAFVTKVNAAGSALVYSTYLGGSAFDTGAGIAIDGNNNAYVTGETSSSNFPTASPTQSLLNLGNNTTNSDAFVTELNSTGSQLIFSTYLGGSGDEDDGGFGAIATNGGNIYVTGDTDSTNFPTQSPYQAANGGGAAGGADAFVVKYSQSTSASFTLSATALSPATVSPVGSATSTVTVTSNNGFSGSVTLTCAISPAVAHAPTCGAASASTGTPGTLTVSTTAATALRRRPANRPSSGLFYAMFLPIGGMALLGFGSSGSRRKKLFGFLLLGLLLSSLLLMPGCGGGSGSSGGGGGGNGGTPAGSYTITVSGTASGASQTGASPSLTLTVN